MLLQALTRLSGWSQPQFQAHIQTQIYLPRDFHSSPRKGTLSLSMQAEHSSQRHPPPVFANPNTFSDQALRYRLVGFPFTKRFSWGKLLPSHQAAWLLFLKESNPWLSFRNVTVSMEQCKLGVLETSQAHVSIAAPAQLYPAPQCGSGGSHSPSIPHMLPSPLASHGSQLAKQQACQSWTRAPTWRKTYEDLNF